MSLGLGLGLPQQRGAAAAAPVAFERILNTTLDSSDNTAAPQGGWTIAAGMATNTIMLRQLQFSLTAPIAAGTVQQVEFGLFANPNIATILIEVFSTVDNSFFLLMDDASPTAGIKTATNIAVTGGPYDRVRIRCADDSGVVIDSLSVIA